MVVEFIILVLTVLVLAGVAWFLWQPWKRGKENLPEQYLRPHSQEGFENLSAGDLHQVEDEWNERASISPQHLDSSDRFAYKHSPKSEEVTKEADS